MHSTSSLPLHRHGPQGAVAANQSQRHCFLRATDLSRARCPLQRRRARSAPRWRWIAGTMVVWAPALLAQQSAPTIVSPARAPRAHLLWQREVPDSFVVQDAAILSDSAVLIWSRDGGVLHVTPHATAALTARAGTGEDLIAAAANDEGTVLTLHAAPASRVIVRDLASGATRCSAPLPTEGVALAGTRTRDGWMVALRLREGGLGIVRLTAACGPRPVFVLRVPMAIHAGERCWLRPARDAVLGACTHNPAVGFVIADNGAVQLDSLPALVPARLRTTGRDSIPLIAMLAPLTFRELTVWQQADLTSAQRRLLYRAHPAHAASPDRTATVTLPVGFVASLPDDPFGAFWLGLTRVPRPTVLLYRVSEE